MGNGSDRRDIGHAVFRVADCFNIDRTRVLVHSLIEFSRIVADHPLDFNLKFPHVDTKLVETTTIYFPKPFVSGALTRRISGVYLHQLVLTKLWPGSQHCVKAMN